MIEQHYTFEEIAKAYHLSQATVKRLFSALPGVKVIQLPRERGKRPYRTLRVPASLLAQVDERLRLTGAQKIQRRGRGV